MGTRHRDHARLEAEDCSASAPRVNSTYTVVEMRNIVRIALVVVLGFLDACNPAPNAAMTGTWIFTLTQLGSTTGLQATANLTQLGVGVTGQVTLTGNEASCGTTASMSGTVSGNALSLQLSQSQSTISFTGTANAAFTSASGTYAASGTCFQNFGTGTWSAALD